LHIFNNDVKGWHISVKVKLLICKEVVRSAHSTSYYEILALLLGIVIAFDMPAQTAFIGDLSGMEEVRHDCPIQ